MSHGNGNGNGNGAKPLYGFLVEFDRGEDLAAAITKTRAEGYRKLDAFTPFPMADVCDALEFRRSEIATITLIGGLVGGTSGFLMQCWTLSVDYPLNIGGRPYISWPSFIPITFELTVLTASLSGLFGLMALCGLPRYHHPIFNAESFARSSRDRFLMLVEAADPKFDPEGTRAFLSGLGALGVEEVPL
jgi:hypothetical protein